MYSHDIGIEAHDIPISILCERKTGLFQRTFTLPTDVDMRDLKAKLEDGLLRIDLPKRDVTGRLKMKTEAEQ